MKSTKQLIKQLESKKKQLAKIRDELRCLEAEFNQYAENADEALHDLSSCVDTLSLYV